MKMKVLIIILILFPLIGCTTLQRIGAALDNSGKHKPVYLREDIPKEVRDQYYRLSMIGGDIAPWPYCAEYNERLQKYIQSPRLFREEYGRQK
jgi:hypothetical protein